MGVDVARQGDDESVVVLRHGRKLLPEIFRVHEPDTMRLAGYIAELINKWQPDTVFVDAVGIGAGVFDRLIQLGFDNVVEVQSGEIPLDKKTYYNLKAEMWARMRDWLGTADIPDDNKLREDLLGPEYYFDEKMRLRIEKSEDMKARGLPSPDTAASLSMTFAHQVPVLRSQESGDLEPDDV
jgi:hypothetical protein